VWLYERFLAMETAIPEIERRPFSIKLWPPSQNTRLLLVDRMTRNLSCPTIFTRKYGILSEDEAKENAKKIEELAFAKADEHYEAEPDGDGSSAVQLYAREGSRLILEVLKKGPMTDEKPSVKTDVVVVPKETSVVPDVLTVPKETFFDLSTGKRAFIEEDEALELLQPLMEPDNSYSKICFSNRSFGYAAAKVAGPILANLKDQLKEVDLSDFIAGRPEDEAIEVMNVFSDALENSFLKILNLSDNALGEKGVRAFGSLLKSQNGLEELYLMNNGISEEAARAVCELIPSTGNLKVLHFHNNMTGDEGALAISQVVKKSPVLENFRCSSTRVGSEGGISLAEALGICANMKKIDLRDNMFGAEAGVILSKSISKHSYLTEIYLSYLNLENEGVIAIANALKDTAPHLQVLEMAGNDITVESVQSLAACIAAKPNLTKLILSENELKDDGAIRIGKVLEDHDELKEVDMSVNQITRVGARVLAQAVVSKPGFTLLNVNGNYISDEGIDELKVIFKKSPEMLGPLDENEPDGEDDDDDDDDNDDENGSNGDDALESKLKDLDVNGEED
jgi:Ran GTPase-activating protein 1